MKAVVWLLVLLVVAAVGAELVLPRLAEAQIEERVNHHVPDAAGVGANLGPFPVITRTLVTGAVPRLTLSLDEVVRQQLEIADVAFTLERVRLDRDALLRGDVEVTGVDTAEVSAAVDAGVAGAVLGDLDALSPELVDLAGRTLSIAGEAVAVPEDLVPCQPEVEAVDDERVVLTCRFDHVPSILVRP